MNEQRQQQQHQQQKRQQNMKNCSRSVSTGAGDGDGSERGRARAQIARLVGLTKRPPLSHAHRHERNVLCYQNCARSFHLISSPSIRRCRALLSLPRSRFLSLAALLSGHDLPIFMEKDEKRRECAKETKQAQESCRTRDKMLQPPLISLLSVTYLISIQCIAFV